MKACWALLVVALAACLLSCGEAEEATISTGGDSGDRAAATATRDRLKGDYSVPRTPPQRDRSGRFATITNRGGSAQPKLHPSNRPAPGRVLVRDLKIGTGPAARPGDRVKVYYLGVNYKTGKRAYFRWPSEPVLSIRLGDDPWEKALVGMKPGGLREAIIPSHLHLQTGTIDFLFNLVDVEGRPAGEG